MHQLNGLWKAAAACCRACCTPVCPRRSWGCKMDIPMKQGKAVPGLVGMLSWSSSNQGPALQLLWGSLKFSAQALVTLTALAFSEHFPRMKAALQAKVQDHCCYPTRFLDLTTYLSQVARVIFSSPPFSIFQPKYENLTIFSTFKLFLRLYEAIVGVLKVVQLL